MAQNYQKSKEPASRTFVYGVYGLTEWHAVIKTGNASIRIPFTGGTVTGFGITPAIFVTKSAAIAGIIENSEYYKTARIKKIT